LAAIAARHSVGDGWGAGLGDRRCPAAHQGVGRSDDSVGDLGRSESEREDRKCREGNHRLDSGLQSIRLVDELDSVTVMVRVGEDRCDLSVAMVMRGQSARRDAEQDRENERVRASWAPPVHAVSMV
jgi:hypothetical protein